MSVDPGQDSPQQSFYERAGGADTFRKLVDVFYSEVAADDVLRALYPEEDLAPAAERLRMFLEQYWGGPRTYSDLRGHPRLRMRHVTFRIGPRERDAWLARMRTAMEGLDLSNEQRTMLWDYLVMAAQSLVNVPSDPAEDPLDPDGQNDDLPLAPGTAR